MVTSRQRGYGVGGPSLQFQPAPIIAQRAPTSTDTNYDLGQDWIDESSIPGALYTYVGGGIWDQGANAEATTTSFGIVQLATLAELQAGNAPAGAIVPLSNDVFTFVNATAIAGAPIAQTGVTGITNLATDAQAVAGTATVPGVTALAVQPSNLAAVFAAPPATGGTTPAAGSFTTLAASGLASLSGSATITTGATALNLASDASTGAVNIGTGIARTNKEVVIDLTYVAEKGIKTKEGAYVEMPHHSRVWVADNTLLKSLGWKEEVGYSAGILRTVEYYAKRFQ
jgi:hypothetical protein